MKRNITVLILLLVLALTGFAQEEQVRRKNGNVNKSGLAIGGYDPVAYLVQKKALEGKKEFAYSYKGITYYFSSDANRNLFKNNPAKYEPAYGGWCAYAMGNTGEKVEVDPETFKVIDGKTYLFYNFYFTNTLDSWNKNEAKLKEKADKNWQKFTAK
ncbi:MAG: YHS domain-containing protein [Bacteroidetes bacterium]|nr:MAG: YHS domain-containing protein [Bacteroidota bacterium]